ncbi:MAG TPA: Ig-like domain-containing protein, partial [Allosphingosinicella sp.]
MVATSLSRGQVAIIQVDAEDNDDPFVNGVQNMNRDSLSFVLLAPVEAGTVIYFTDRSWNGSAFAAASGSAGAQTGENTYAWTAGSNYVAGTVITITTAELAAAGISLSAPENAASGETIYAYQGANADTPTTFLFAIEVGDGNTTFDGSLVNTGLTVGLNAVTLAQDNVSFGERTWNINTPVLLQNIVDPTNWNTNDNSPQTDQVEGTNLFVAPNHQLWMAGISGGHALISVNQDSTQNGGLGYDQQHYFQNLGNDGNATTNTQRFWSPTHILFDTVQGKFFIVDSSGSYDRILQGNISDLLANPGVAPTMTILWQDQVPGVSDGDGITGMQIDKVNGHIYFTADNTLLRVSYNASNQTAVTLANLGTDTDTGSKNWANEIALDTANSRVFIVSTETFSDFQDVPSNYPGAQPDPDRPGFYYALVTTVRQNSIHMVANVTPADTNATGNVVTQLSFSAGYSENNSVATTTPQADEFEDSLGRITDVDINTTTGEIWFTAIPVGVPNAKGGIYKATLNVATGTLTVTTIHSDTDASARNYMHIHIDEETGQYFVSSLETGAANGGISTVYAGLLNSAANTSPTLFANVGNVNSIAPRDLTLESAPTLTGSGIAGLAVTEASSAPNSGETTRVTLFSGLTASDIDTPNTGDELAGAIVRISSGFTYEAASTATGHTGTMDYLRINGLTSGTTASGITFNYNSVTGTMTLSGAATVAEYKAVLELVQFSTSGDNVTQDGNATTRTVSASVFDGLLYSDEINAIVSVTGINDAPVNTVGAAMNFTEDTTGTVGQASPSVIAPVNAITGISIGDADADATTETFTVTLSVVFGTLTIRTDVTGGLTPLQVSGNGTALITVTGTQNAINATLAATTAAAQGSLPNGLVYTPDANFNGADRLSVVTNDQGNNGNDPGTTGTGTTEEDRDNKILNVADVNDAPTVIDTTQDATTILEDTPGAGQTVTALFGASFADALDRTENGISNPTGYTGDTLAGIAVTANGSSATTGQWQWYNGTAWQDVGAVTTDAAKTFAAGTLIRFNPVLNFNGAAPTLTAYLIESSASAVANNATVDLNPAPPTIGNSAIYTATPVVLSQAVTAVNDASTSTNLQGNVATWTEHSSPSLLDESTNATISDVDSANFDTGTLTVSIGTGLVAAQDVLEIRAGSGISTSTNTVLYNGVQIGTFTGGTSGAPLVITFDADATPVAVQSLIRAIGYSNTGGDNPTAGTRTINWSLVDGDGVANAGADTLNVTSTVNVIASNDTPSVGGTGVLNPRNFVEGVNGAADHIVVNNSVVFTDPDDTTFSYVTVAITANFVAAEDVLAFANTDTAVFGDIVGSYNATTGVLTLTSPGGAATLAQFQAAARAVTYDNSSEEPTQTTRTVQIIAHDGNIGGNVTFSLTVTAQNDSPAGANSTATINEDAALTLTAAHLGFTDVDGDALQGVRFGVAPTGGTLYYDADGVGTGNAAVAVTTFPTTTYSVADLNAGKLTFVPTANANGTGAASINFTVVDNGGTTGAGQNADLTPNTLTINITSLNDAPEGANRSGEVASDAVYTFTGADFSTGMTDASDTPAHSFGGVRITTLPAANAGILYYDADGAGPMARVAVAANTDFTAQQLID